MRKESPGFILLEDNFRKLPLDVQKKYLYPNRPNVAFKLSEETFNRINNGDIGGFGAYIEGNMKIEGNLLTAMKFDSNVIRRYNPDAKYTKKTATNEVAAYRATQTKLPKH